MIRINATCAIINIAILLPVVPRYGLIGAAAVTVLTEVVRLVMALRFAHQEGFSAPNIGRFVKPTLAAGVMIPVLLLAGDQPFFVQLLLGALVYGSALLATGVLRREGGFRLRVVV